MPNLSGLVTQLKKAPDRMQQQLTGLNAALTAFAGVYGKQELSLDARCQQKHAHELQPLPRARWAKVNEQDAKPRNKRGILGMITRLCLAFGVLNALGGRR